MKGRVGKTILTILTIFALTFSYFVILGNVISYALDSLEEQITKVNEQTYFDVYFKDGQNKVHTKLNNIKNGEAIKKPNAYLTALWTFLYPLSLASIFSISRDMRTDLFF